MDRYTLRPTRASMLMIWIGIGMSWGCAMAPSCPPAETLQGSVPQALPSPAPVVAPSTAALEHKVKVQEKRIAELSTQLKMLKRIDFDGKKER